MKLTRRFTDSVDDAVDILGDAAVASANLMRMCLGESENIDDTFISARQARKYDALTRRILKTIRMLKEAAK